MRRRFRRTTVITLGLIAFLAGLGLARTGIALPVMYVWISLLVLFVGVRKFGATALLSVLLFGGVFGWWRGSNFLKQMEPYRQLSGRQVVILATVHSDAVYSDQGQLSFDVDRIMFSEPITMRVPGRIAVQGFGEQAVYRGDVLRIEGRLQPTKGSRQARLSFSQFSAVARNQAIMEKLRRSFVAGVATALPEPAASFGLGLLIGYRTTLSEITTQQLAITGLTHIIAVSGYNLTIIIRSVRRLLTRRSKYQQTVVAIVMMVLFLLVTDFSASIIRASIVSALSLAAWYYGRRFKPLLIIALAATLTAGWNPLYIWSDVGWYLSFLAFFGILVISPLAVTWLFSKHKRQPEIVLLLIETTSAQLMTAPLILFIFSRVSLVGLVSNLLIAPLVPLAMVLTLVAGLSGMVTPVLAGWLAWPARMLLGYMLEVVALFARIPNALIKRSISLGQMLLMYTIIVLCTLVVWRIMKLKYDKITEKDIID